jgi:hypothetical protein
MLHRERERLDCLLSRDFGSFAPSAESMDVKRVPSGRRPARGVAFEGELAAPNKSFPVCDQPDHVCRAVQQQNITFFFSEIVVLCPHPASHEGRFAIVTDVDAGCGGRAGLQRG